MKIKNLLLASLLITSPVYAEYKYNNTKSVLSLGPNMGYNLTEAYTVYNNDKDAAVETRIRRFKINNYSLGIHIDYNYPVSPSYFVGGGYSISHLPLGKEYNTFATSMAINERESGRDINYKNKVDVLFHKKNSQYFTVRLGKFLSERVSVHTNLSMVISQFQMNGAIFTYEKINGLAGTYNFNRFRDDVESKMDFSRVGVAPGLGINVRMSDDYSVGANYAYEIYPANKDGSRPRMTTHNFLTKFSYHL